MFPHCVYCGLRYERETGYFLGSIYFNYGLTAMLVAIGYPLLVFGFQLPADVVFMSGIAVLCTISTLVLSLCEESLDRL
jgi:hypothetical protein